jgi:hypothetical protein
MILSVKNDYFQFIFVMVKCCVFFAVRTEFLYIIQTSFGFKGLIILTMKITVFWDVAPCSLVEVDRRFRGAYFLHHQRIPETSVRFHETTRRSIPEDSHIHTGHRENLKSHLSL